jgi:hypothetical protein
VFVAQKNPEVRRHCALANSGGKEKRGKAESRKLKAEINSFRLFLHSAFPPDYKIYVIYFLDGLCELM